MTHVVDGIHFKGLITVNTIAADVFATERAITSKIYPFPHQVGLLYIRLVLYITLS